MVFESTENSSPTVPLIPKTIVADRSNHGPMANTSSKQEASGSSRTSTVGASTVGTLARFLPQSSNTDFGPCARFIQKSLSHSAFLPALAAISSAIAWSGHVVTIPLSLLAPLLLYKAQSRSHSYATLFAYYIGASWPLIPGASTFFGTHGSVLEGLPLCLGAAALLATPAVLLFTRN